MSRTVQNNTDMNNSISIPPKLRYAIHFDSLDVNQAAGHPGYLLIDSCGSGAHGVTMRVHSLLDRQVYIRKLHDAARIDGTEFYQCIDARYNVMHTNVPRLHGVRDFTAGIVRGYAVAASTWQFCNGGTLNECLNTLYMENFHNPRQLTQLPEVCLWQFLKTMLGVLLHAHQKGVVHRDVHDGNVFLHWPTAESVLPELFLGDFGCASRYPYISNPAFNAPFKGEFKSDIKFNLESDAASHSLTVQEFVSLRRWYSGVASDIFGAINLLTSSIVVAGEANGEYANPADRLFETAVENDRGLYGYSKSLIEAIVTWSRIVQEFGHRPYSMLQRLAQLHSNVSLSAQEVSASELPRLNPSMNWYKIKLPHPPKMPAMWRDPSDIMDFGTYDSSDEEPQELSKHSRLTDNCVHLPHIDVQAESMENSVRLRRGQFRVVQLVLQDGWLNGSNWKLVRFIDSLEEADALSPTTPFSEPEDNTVEVKNETPNDIASPHTTSRPVTSHELMAASHHNSNGNSHRIEEV